MATMQRIQPKFSRTTIPGVQPQQRGGAMETYFKETASQSWGIGDLIYLDSNGTLALCTTSSSRHNSATAGIAVAAASGVTGTAVIFHAIRPDDQFVMNVYHSTIGSAITAQTQLGVRYGIILATNGAGKNVWMVDIENTTVEDATTALARVKVVGFPDKGVDTTGAEIGTTIGDTYGLVRVQFLENSIASDGSPVFLSLLQLG